MTWEQWVVAGLLAAGVAILVAAFLEPLPHDDG